jgi:SpoVK/Ycf46/Vps4 family AAA+-type ATPase
LRVYTDKEEGVEEQITKLIDGKRYRLRKDGWQNIGKSWSKMQALAGTTIGRILARDASEGEASESSVVVRWEDVLAASRAERLQETQLDEQIKRHLPKQTPTVSPSDDKSASEPTPTPSAGDLVIKRVKKAKDLTSHEKRLLGSIVDTTKIASTTFQEVHLPFKTIDAVRTVVSLPLLFPEAFLGGVLKDHSTTGALLFGPPGTGKTLLARAVANESGARMLAIQVCQPS